MQHKHMYQLEECLKFLTFLLKFFVIFEMLLRFLLSSVSAIREKGNKTIKDNKSIIDDLNVCTFIILIFVLKYFSFSLQKTKIQYMENEKLSKEKTLNEIVSLLKS